MPLFKDNLKVDEHAYNNSIEIKANPMMLTSILINSTKSLLTPHIFKSHGVLGFWGFGVLGC